LPEYFFHEKAVTITIVALTRKRQIF